MKRLLVLVVFLLVVPQLVAATHVEKIDGLISAYNKLHYFNGSALVAETGKVVLRKGYGLANMEWQIPNAPDTKFRLGSITKQFTSMVVMQLVNEGKINLDEKITTYLPDYRKDTGDKVTVRHLLTHTSGIPSYTAIPGFFQNESRNPYEVAAFIKKFASGDLEFEPGSQFSYDNSGYFLLGAIIEKVTGKTYEQALRERIFDPLGMKDTGYDKWSALIPKRATGYRLTPDGYENAPYLDMTIPYAAGSLYSTVDDMVRWDRALYTDKLLPAALKQTMFTPYKNNYAFGWFVNKLKLDDDKTELPMITHGGGINGFNTVELRFPDTQDLVVLLDNTSRGDKLDALAKGIVDVIHGIEPPKPKPGLVDNSGLLSKKGADLVAALREIKTTGVADVSDREVNRLGYYLLSRDRIADAIEVFRYNVSENPQSWNVYDSLGEAYARHGDRDLAIANYKKSLELDPKNANAQKAIDRLTAAPAKLDGDTLQKYVGTYQLGPGFNLTITRDGATLYGQATGQPRVELVADSPTEFHLTVVDAKITFMPDGSALVLHQGGRDMRATRVAQ